MRAKDLLKLIPNHVRVTHKVTYEVLWCDGFFKDGKQLGECDGVSKQIKISKNQSATEQYKTYLHELLHAISFETEGLNLTERQVMALEAGLYRVYRLNDQLK